MDDGGEHAWRSRMNFTVANSRGHLGLIGTFTYTHCGVVLFARSNTRTVSRVTTAEGAVKTTLGLLALVSVFAMATPEGARAESHRLAEKLLADCTAEKNDAGFQIKRAACDNYLAGTYDLLFARMSVAAEACVARTITRERLRAMIVDYLKRHPEDLSYSAATAVRAAASEAWPKCSFS